MNKYIKMIEQLSDKIENMEAQHKSEIDTLYEIEYEKNEPDCCDCRFLDIKYNYRFSSRDQIKKCLKTNIQVENTNSRRYPDDNTCNDEILKLKCPYKKVVVRKKKVPENV